MRKGKRGGGDLSRNFCKNRKAGEAEWISGCLRDGDSSQDLCTKLSDWGKSVVSISLCNGDITLFSCSGMAIGHEGNRLTRFLTSASLVKAFDGKTNEHYFDLKIEVRREGKEVYRGFLAEYDLVHDFVVVKVSGFRDVNVGVFHHKLKSVPHGEAYVVGRDVSGDLTAKSVELSGDLRVCKDDKDLDSKTSKAWEGATIFSFDGEVVGMNLFLVTERAIFLPWGTLFKCLDRYWTFWEKARGLARSTSLVHGFGAPAGGKSNSHPEEGTSADHLDLIAPGHRDRINQERDLGYPESPATMQDAGMVLVNTFEDPFGDIRGTGVWKNLGEKASSRIDRSVVALTSFNGEKINFVCTGFFIGWNGSTKILTSASLIRNSDDDNNIVENLRIEVLLPNDQIINGTLEHYDLHYNIALVSVENRYDLRQAKTLPSRPRCYVVAAVERCFKSHALMATSGKLISSTSALDCDLLVHSSCKITKLGIGGPLVTLDGVVLGMNFFDEKIGTPVVLWADIAKILASFETRSKPGEICNDTSGVPSWKMDGDRRDRFNRWPVPKPCWRLPDYVDEDKFDADQREYCYVKGVKFRLL